MTAANSARAATHIRGLASLDVGGLELLPLILDRLRHVLSFDSAAYYHLDERGSPQLWTEDAAVLSMLPFYLSEDMQAAERAVTKPFERAVREDFGPKTRTELSTIPWHQFEKSDYFNLLLRPLEIHDCVSLILRQPGRPPTGALKFYRRSRRAEFRREELTELTRLEPFLASALRPHAAFAADLNESSERALVVTTLAGQPLWMSSPAKALLLRAFGKPSGDDPVLPEPLRRALALLRSRPNGGEAAPPHVAWRGPHGSFVAEARLLEPSNGCSPAVAIELTQRTPRRLRLLRRLAQLQLPARQFEIACWLTSGCSETKIAAELGVSLNTLVYHRRRLYERLAVHSRRELLVWLAEAPATG
jgi:DNA-binding CsgD family transcriptional regulator